MTSYLSSLTSHYTSLKRLLPNSLSADSDLSCTDPEDSHVARVMRAYYTEKGRVFPPWLGPDPRQPERLQPASITQSRYGQMQEPENDGFRRNRGSSGAPGALDDLFGNGPPLPSREPAPRERGPRGRLNQPPPPREQAPAPMARPLPSQRQGSNQNPRNNLGGGFNDDTPGGGSAPSREQTAAERLKARLGGARSTTPTESAGGYDRPSSGRSAAGNPYDRGTSNPYEGRSGGGGRSNPYGSGASRNPYDAAPPDRYGGGGGGGKPYTGASAPWSSGEDGYGDGGGYGRRAQGLPSNPRRR